MLPFLWNVHKIVSDCQEVDWGLTANGQEESFGMLKCCKTG